jgi:hypothetical protein
MRTAVAVLALALVACEGRSPVEPQKTTVNVVGRVQDASTGALVPSSITFWRDAAPGASITINAPTGEFWAVLVPSSYHVSAVAPGYQPTIIELAALTDTTVTIGVRP